METKNILLISTGGTIAGNTKNDTKDHLNAKDFEKSIAHTVETIKNQWGTNVMVTSVDLMIDDKVIDLDSSDIEPLHWTALVEKVYKEYDNYQAFIITHGTNILGYTSAALSFAFPNINKPVILTGSQVPFGNPGSDALMNLDNSLRIAAWPYDKIRGVIVVFGSSIITGTRVKKTTDFDYDAFTTFSANNLGKIGRIIQINKNELEGHNKFYSPKEMDTALTQNDLVISKNFEPNIVSLTEFPGMSDIIFKTMVEQHQVKGFILRSFGAGDPNHKLTKAFEYLKKNHIPIVITTQAPNGNANFQVNKPGQILKEKKLATPAYNMSMEAITTKLSWLLAQYPEANVDSYNKIISLLHTNLKGEIDVMNERKQ